MLKYYYYSKENEEVLRDYFPICEDYLIGQKVTKLQRSKVEDTFYNIIYNASRCGGSKGNILTIRLDCSAFKGSIILNGKAYKIKVPYRTFRKALSWMESKGYLSVYSGGKKKYVELEDGEDVKYAYDGRELSQITILPKLLELSGALSLKREELDNVLILRNAGGEEVEFKSDRMKESMIGAIQQYNSKIVDYTFIDGNGEEIQKPQLKRIFNEKWECGGRFYTDSGIIQTMPSKDRRKITIDGKKVKEIDVWCIHPAILYTEAGITMDHDPYGYEMVCSYDKGLIEAHRKKYGLSLDYDPLRAIKKVLLLTSLNASTETAAMFAACSKLGLDKRIPIRDRKYIGISRVNMVDSLENLKWHNFALEDKFCKGWGMMLQWKDSGFMSRVLMSATQDDVPIIPIHDSVLIQEDRVEEGMQYMRDSWEGLFGNLNNFRLSVK